MLPATVQIAMLASDYPYKHVHGTHSRSSSDNTFCSITEIKFTAIIMTITAMIIPIEHRVLATISSRPRQIGINLLIFGASSAQLGTYSQIELKSGSSGKGQFASKIRGDAFALPVAVAGRFRALRTLQLLLRRRGAGRSRSLAACFGLGQRALGGRRERLAGRAGNAADGGEGSSVMAILLRSTLSCAPSVHR